MKRVEREELFTHVTAFLKNKGIELQPGSCTRVVEKGCQVLTDTINLSQEALGRAKSEIETQLERARRIIHEKTAPRKGSSTAKKPEGKNRAESSKARGRGTRRAKSASRKRGSRRTDLRSRR